MATTNKYDRQLRLWGAKGQKALAETTVLLIRATAAGTETLKNLVLPGIGQIVVLDDVTLTADDGESNFFVTEAGSKKPRAQIALELLQELNPDVHGRHQHVESLAAVNYSKVFASLQSDGNRKIIVVASDLEPALLMQVAEACTNDSVPLVVVQSAGLLGLVRLQTPTMPILDPKPDNSTPDLRLVRPFSKFKAYCDAVQLSELVDHEHSHVPYPVLLYKFAQEWKSTHDDKLPSSFQEKQAFREFVKSKSRNWDMQVNFHEAVNNVYLAYSEKTVDRDHLQGLLEKIEKGGPALSKTSVLLQSVIRFMDNHGGEAPLNGTLPDMTASTKAYVDMQQLYRDEAQSNLEEIHSYCSSGEGEITQDDVRVVCQNVFDLDVYQTRTLHQEYETVPTTDVVEDLQSATWDPYETPEHTPLLWYLSLRASRAFHLQHGRFPGTTDSWQADIPLVQAILQQVCQELQLDETDLIKSTVLSAENKFAAEISRQANAEIHTIASVVGGVAAQEAVKLITGLYVPLNNTYVYNGMASVGGVYQF